MTAWMFLVPFEAAIVLAAAYSNFGGLFPLIVLLGLAIAERVGLAAARPEAMTGLIFAPSAAVCVALAARMLDKAWRARLRRNWLHGQAGLSASSDLFLWVDSKGRILEVGSDLTAALRVDAERFSGQTVLHRIHIADKAAFLNAFDLALQTDDTTAATVRMLAGDLIGADADAQPHRPLWFEARMRRLVGGARANTAAVAVALRDISDAKEAEQRLERLRVEAAAAISMKDRLLANVSHELRTPLNAILGFSEILADPSLSPASSQQRFEYARIVHASAQHLLSVVNLLLDISKLEAGRYEIEPEPFEIGALIKNCVDMLRLKAEEKAITIESSSQWGSLELVADKRACRQILLNLLANAVKFTPGGGRVSIDLDVSEGFLEIIVSDTGIGIAAEHLPRLGDPFFQARSGYDRDAEGAGLGLALVRGFVGLHGGSIAIASSLGVGTRVVVKLPRDGKAAAAATAQPGTPGFEILPVLTRRKVETEPLPLEERKIA
jgi:cell cycle sensor histidine kinase DivJ